MAVSAQSSRFAAILSAVAERLRSELDLDSMRVRVTKKGRYKEIATAEQFIAVRTVRGVYFGDAGAGRHGMPITRVIAIDVWTRNSIDEFGSDEVALTEEDRGHFDTEEAVANALVLWSPSDEEDTPLTTEPIHPVEATDDPDAPDDERSRGYLVSTLYFDCRYVSQLTI